MKLILTSAAAALIMLGASAASAQGQGPGAAVHQACAADYAKFCPDKTGKDRHECMMAHKDEVSDGCKSAAMAAMKARQEMKAGTPQ